jgi:type II pantothenate kinase
MSELQNRTVIGIDRGASFTDFGVLKSGALIDTASLEKRDWDSICSTYDQLNHTYQAETTVFTGSVADMPADLKQSVQVISEIDAVGFGGSWSAGFDECIVASIGTGSAIVHFANNQARHMGGTGVGGGTIKGLCALLCNLHDPAEIEATALKGNPSHLNLTISDLGYESISFLGSDMTASNFAAVKSHRIEDLAAAILRLVGETVGIIASLCAREAGCMDKIVIVGKVAQDRFIRHTLELVGKLYQTRFVFPENPGYATVYGAAIKSEFDRQERGNDSNDTN